MKVTGISTPTRPFAQNEDWLGSSSSMVALLDGVGLPDVLPSDVETGCRHGVGWFVKTLGTALLQHGEDTERPLREVLAAAITGTAASHERQCDLKHPLTPAATVVLVRENSRTVDYLVLSDSTLIIDDGSPEPLVVNDDRVSRLDLPGFGDTAPDSRRYREIASTRVHEAALMRNHPDGYPIASTDPNAASAALTGTVKRDGLRRALAASDGATRLVDRFEQLTWSELLDVATTNGPEEVIARTREVENADTKCLAWPRGKAYDDATIALCLWD